MINYRPTPGFDFSTGLITPEISKDWLKQARDTSIEQARVRGPDPVTRGEKLALFGTESVNSFYESVARAIRGTASLIADDEDMESLDKHIGTARDFLRGPSPYYQGQETFTETPVGGAVAEGAGYILPYVGLRKIVTKGLKGFPSLSKKYQALSAKQKIGIDALGFGLSDFIVADPTDLHTFGDYLGGPTAIKPDDSVMEKKAKVLAESIVLGGSISAAAHGLGRPFSKGKPPKYNTDPKSLEKGQKAIDPDNNIEYTWLGAQWVNDATGQMATKKV